MFSLAGKHALVTGATSPLARGLALALAEAGAKVSVTTSTTAQSEHSEANSILEACRAIASEAGEAYSVDLTDPASVEEAIDSLERDVAPIDILVNAAHDANLISVLDASVADWRHEFERNATSAFISCQAVGRRMLPRAAGRIINLVSVVHDRGIANCALFSASQGAVLGLTRSLAIEWGRGEPLVEQRLTINALGIGFFDDVPGPQQDPAVRAILERYIPLRRLGKTDDLRSALVYLASDVSNYIQGELITIDGAITTRA